MLNKVQETPGTLCSTGSKVSEDFEGWRSRDYMLVWNEGPENKVCERK